MVFDAVRRQRHGLRLIVRIQDRLPARRGVWATRGPGSDARRNQPVIAGTVDVSRLGRFRLELDLNSILQLSDSGQHQRRALRQRWRRWRPIGAEVDVSWAALADSTPSGAPDNVTVMAVLSILATFNNGSALPCKV